MANVTIYLKCDRNVEVQSQDVFLSDMGQLRCADPHVSAKCKAIKVHRFEKNGAKRCVISSSTRFYRDGDRRRSTVGKVGKTT